MTASEPASNAPASLPLRVLLIDDDAVSRDVISLLLASAGHAVTTAADGEEALSLLAADGPAPPQVVLADLNLPGLAGAELGHRLRHLAGDEAHLVAISARRPHTIDPYSGFLPKPFDLDAFHALLGGGGASGSDAAAAPPTGDGQAAVLEEAIYTRLQAMMPLNAIQEIYEACLGDTLRRIPQMERDLAANRPDEVRRTAHAIRGGASMVGATRLASIAARLELDRYESATGLHLLEEMSSACEDLRRILLIRNS